MKLHIINPIYTSIFSVIIFAALTSSFSLYHINGKTYINSKYEVVYGGNKTLRIDGVSLSSLKSYRILTADEQLKLRETEEKNEKEFKNRNKAREKERILREAVRGKEREQRKKERRMREMRRKRKQKRREAERVQRGAKKLRLKKRVPINQKKRSFYNSQKSLRSRGAGRKILVQNEDQIIEYV